MAQQTIPVMVMVIISIVVIFLVVQVNAEAYAITSSGSVLQHKSLLFPDNHRSIMVAHVWGHVPRAEWLQ